jgi:hypothetical protein
MHWVSARRRGWEGTANIHGRTCSITISVKIDLAGHHPTAAIDLHLEQIIDLLCLHRYIIQGTRNGRL